MATYKVLQDIEAEDKLVGPLTLRQFIYAGIFALCLYLGFIAVTKHLTFFLVILLPVALFAAFFAFPWKLNQPTETWALAMIKFFVKPRKRIWNQSGAKELVTVTAPKTEETNYTNNLSEGEVQSRLKTLADVLDSRGWAVKNSSNTFNYRAGNSADTDRLVSITPIGQIIEPTDALDSDDILDDNNNPTAQRFSQMITNSSQTRVNDIKERLRIQQHNALATNTAVQQPSDLTTPPNDVQNNKWFVNSPTDKQDSTPRVELHSFDSTTTNTSTLRPLVVDPPIVAQTANAPIVTQPPNPVILNFAGNNDLNIATLARQINKQQGNGLQNEVVVQLH